MTVKAINDLSRNNEPIAAELHEAARRVVDSGWYVLGAEVAAFEREFAAYCGVAECVSVANGTDGLELALRALGAGVGSRVATVANAGMYSSVAIAAIGAKAVYVDVDDASLLMSPDALAATSLRGCAALVVTHLYGRLAEVEALCRIAREAGVPVLEDCAQSHGARLGAKICGSFGAAGSYSFYPTKNLGALGDGGAVVTGDARLAAEIRKLRQYGWKAKYHADQPGGRNSRLDEMQAAFLRVKLKYLDGWNDRRRAVAARLCKGISHPQVRAPRPPDASDIAHLFVVRCENRHSLAAHLKSRSIPFDVHYPVADHRQAAMRDVAEPASLPVTERACDTVLSLPCFPEMTFDEVDAICAAVNDWAPSPAPR